MVANTKTHHHQGHTHTINIFDGMPSSRTRRFIWKYWIGPGALCKATRLHEVLDHLHFAKPSAGVLCCCLATSQVANEEVSSMTSIPMTPYDIQLERKCKEFMNKISLYDLYVSQFMNVHYSHIFNYYV